MHWRSLELKRLRDEQVEMKDRFFTILLATGLTVGLIITWIFALNSNPKPDFEALHAAQTNGSGILDGMIFTGKAGIIGRPLDISDTWSFDKGTFVSTECETQCNYPRAPYYVRENSDAVDFVGETHCLDKDAKISWRGSVEGDKIKGTFTWNVKRWYWTIEKNFWFEGQLTASSDGLVNN